MDFRCNKASVALEPVIETEDINLLKNMIYRHHDATQSPRARHILENWNTILPKFVKVFPHEFRKALERQKAKAAATAPILPSASVSSSQVNA